MAESPASEFIIDSELERSEAYQHGRTQHRLWVARQALGQIAIGKTRNMDAVRAVAKMALDMTREDEHG